MELPLLPRSSEAACGPAKKFLAAARSYPEKFRPERLRPVDSGMLVSQPVGDAIFAASLSDKTSASAFAINQNGDRECRQQERTLWTQNVVALWEGTTPR